MLFFFYLWFSNNIQPNVLLENIFSNYHNEDSKLNNFKKTAE